MDEAAITNGLRGYLLGALSVEERERIERELLGDDAVYELLLAVEEELIDESIRGELSPDEVSNFLEYLGRLSDGRRRLELARDLDAHFKATRRAGADVASKGRRFGSWRAQWVRFAPAAVVLLALLGGIGSAIGVVALRAQLAALRAELAVARASERELQDRLLEARVRAEERATSSNDPAPYVLTAGVLRGAGSMQTVRLLRSQPILRLNLDLGRDDYETYRAVLRDSEAVELVAISGLRARASEARILVPFAIPTAGLEAGDYSISLSGVLDLELYEPIARYDVRIVID